MSEGGGDKEKMKQQVYNGERGNGQHLDQMLKFTPPMRTDGQPVAPGGQNISCAAFQ